jgi:hypothetical protein
MMSTEIARVEGNSLTERMAYAKALAVASLLPKAYRENPGNVLLAMELGDALGIRPIQAINAVHVIEGKPSASADLIASLVRKAGHKLRITGDDQSATAQIIRADDPDYTFEATWTIERARAASLTSKTNWKSYPAAMLKARAITEVARMGASDALYGVIYTPEELGAEVDEMGEVVSRQAAPKRTGMAGLRDAVQGPKAEEPVDADVVTEDPEPTEPDLIDPHGKQMKALHASMNEAGYGERDKGLSYLTALLDRQVGSTKELTVGEASRVLDDLKSILSDPFPTEPPAEEAS